MGKGIDAGEARKTSSSTADAVAPITPAAAPVFLIPVVVAGFLVVAAAPFFEPLVLSTDRALGELETGLAREPEEALRVEPGGTGMVVATAG